METRSLWRCKGATKSENVDVLKSSGKKPDIKKLQKVGL